MLLLTWHYTNFAAPIVDSIVHLTFTIFTKLICSHSLIQINLPYKVFDTLTIDHIHIDFWNAWMRILPIGHCLHTNMPSPLRSFLLNLILNYFLNLHIINLIPILILNKILNFANLLYHLIPNLKHPYYSHE